MYKYHHHQYSTTTTTTSIDAQLLLLLLLLLYHRFSSFHSIDVISHGRELLDEFMQACEEFLRSHRAIFTEVVQYVRVLVAYSL
jgi:uncharacterized membrane protein